MPILLQINATDNASAALAKVTTELGNLNVRMEQAGIAGDKWQSAVIAQEAAELRLAAAAGKLAGSSLNVATSNATATRALADYNAEMERAASIADGMAAGTIKVKAGLNDLAISSQKAAYFWNEYTSASTAASDADAALGSQQARLLTALNSVATAEARVAAARREALTVAGSPMPASAAGTLTTGAMLGGTEIFTADAAENTKKVAAALAGLNAQLDGVGISGSKYQQATLANEAATARLSSSTAKYGEALADQVKAVSAASDAQNAFNAALAKVKEAEINAANGMTTQADAALELTTATTKVIDASKGLVDAQAAEAAAIGRTTDTYAALIAAQRSVAASTEALNLASTPTPAKVAARDAALINPRGVAAATIGRGSILSALGTAAFSPEGMAVGGAVYIAYRAAKANAGFQSAEAQTAAQVGADPSTAEGRKQIARTQVMANDILDYVTSGNSSYKATPMMAAIEPLLAVGYSDAANKAALLAVAQLSGQNKAPDIKTAVSGLDTWLQLEGKGPNASPTDIKAAHDTISKAETITTINPGDLSRALPRLLAGILKTGITPDEALASLIKVGIANPRSLNDTTSLSRLFNEMLVHNTAGAQKEAKSLGLEMGPGSLGAYGNSLQAMVQAYIDRTAGPNQAFYLSKLFPTTGNVTGGLMAFKELMVAGGTQQTLGYEGKMALNAGAGQAAYDAYSKGINQQGTQLLDQVNGVMIHLGDRVNTYVTPALEHMGKTAFTLFDQFIQHPGGIGSGNILGDIGRQLDTWATQVNLPASEKNGPLGAAGNLIGNTWSGINSGVGWFENTVGSRLGPAMNQAQQQYNSLLGGNSDTPHSVWDAFLSQSKKHATSPVDISQARSSFGPLGFNPLPSYLAADLSNAGPAPAGATGMPAWVSGQDERGAIAKERELQAALQLTAQYQAQANLAGQFAGVLNGPTRDARSNLNYMETTGSFTKQQMDAQLAILKAVLPTSAYDKASQRDILAKETKKANAYDRSLLTPDDTIRVGDRSDALALAKAMGDTPAQLKVIFDEYIAAERQLLLDTPNLTKTALAAGTNRINREVQTFGIDQGNTKLQRKLKDLQDQLGIDQALNAPLSKQQADKKAITDLNAANAQRLSLDPQDIALMRAQDKAALGTPLTNIKPFFEQNVGLSGFQAGPESTSVRIGGAEENPLVVENRALRAEVTTDNREIIRLLAVIASHGISANVASPPRTVR